MDDISIIIIHLCLVIIMVVLLLWEAKVNALRVLYTMLNCEKCYTCGELINTDSRCIIVIILD